MLRFSLAVACVCALLFIVTTPAAAFHQGLDLLPTPPSLLPTTKPQACYLPNEQGLCKAYMPRWYYDVRKDACLFFVYGGCGGNANRFRSKESCERVCRPRRGRPEVKPWSYVDDSAEEYERPKQWPYGDDSDEEYKRPLPIRPSYENNRQWPTVSIPQPYKHDRDFKPYKYDSK